MNKFKLIIYKILRVELLKLGIPLFIVSLSIFLLFSLSYTTRLEALEQRVETKDDLQQLKEDNAMMKKEIEQLKEQINFCTMMNVTVCHDSAMKEVK